MPATGQPRDLPPMWLLLALLAMLGLHFTWPLGVWLRTPWTLVGWGVLTASAVLAAGSALRFTRAGTGVKPFSPATVLVAAGAYRWTRNPMYVGLVGIVAGVAIVLGTASPAAVPPLLWLVLDRRFVRREEEFLRQRFGADYEAFCARVRRWL